MIKAIDYITTAFSADDAEKISKAILPLISQKHKIVVDFDGVSIFTALFFNNTFARILVEIGPEQYNKQFCLKNLTELGEATYKHSLDNALNFILSDDRTQ